MKFSSERMTGHQQLVNDVKFSPDTRYVVSASFDKSIRLWNGITGKYVIKPYRFIFLRLKSQKCIQWIFSTNDS